MDQVFFAAFYRTWTPVDGWHERLTVPCDCTGHLLHKSDWDRVAEEKWRPVGFYELGKTPDRFWDAALATAPPFKPRVAPAELDGTLYNQVLNGLKWAAGIP